MRLGQAILACAALALAACGQAATSAKGSSGADAFTSRQASFVANAAMFENYAIQSAELAEQNGQSAAVKAYAAAAITEHRAALQQLIAAAQASGMPAPNDALDENYQAYLALLRRPNPADFDTTYASQQSIAFMSASGQYDTFIASAPESELRDWAQAQTDRLHDSVSAAHALANNSGG
jgi:putative membrane protein